MSNYFVIEMLYENKQSQGGHILSKNEKFSESEKNRMKKKWQKLCERVDIVDLKYEALKKGKKKKEWILFILLCKYDCYYENNLIIFKYQCYVFAKLLYIKCDNPM